MSFTHDESLTYQTIKGLPDFKNTANNHLLNTFLTKVSASLFGFSELALRLPNVLAFIAYVYFIYRFFYKGTPITLLALPILLLNPFILDFFSLSRGYGLAIAFFTGSLYYFIQHITFNNSKYLAYALLLSLLCVYANFSFLTAAVALYFTCFFFYAKDRQFDFKIIPLLYLLQLAALYPAYAAIKALQSKGELYFGGEKNIIDDSLYSLIKCSFQLNILDKTNVLILFISIFIYIIVLLLKKNKQLKYLLTSTATTLTIILLLNALTGTRFPIERSILYLPILLGIGIKYALEATESENYRLVNYSLISTVVSLSFLHMVNFYKVANLTSTYTWAYDSNTRDALNALHTRIEPTKKYKLGCTWLFEPTVNYYRETKGYTWLEPVSRGNVSDKCDYYYILEDDGSYKSKGQPIEIIKFSDSKSKLLYEDKPAVGN